MRESGLRAALFFRNMPAMHRSIPLLLLPILLLIASSVSAEPGGNTQPTPDEPVQLKSAPLKPTPVVGVGSIASETAPQADTAIGGIGEPEPAVEAPRKIEPVDEFDVAHIDELIALELPALALSIIDQQQQRVPRFSPMWYLMERKRISVMVLLERWQDIIQRSVVALQQNPRVQLIPQEIVDWFRTQQAVATLNAGDAEGALKLLGQMIWSQTTYQREVVFALWRRLVINAYLQNGNIADAERAMLRYDYDYRDSAFALTEDWKYTRAGVLLRLERYPEVMQQMSERLSHLERQYYLLAKLRAEPESMVSVLDEIEQLTSASLISRKDRWAYRYIVYEAALSTDEDALITQRLQDLLSVGEVSHSFQQIIDVDADDWWQRYRSKGEALGNRFRLLRGDDVAWYAKAAETRQHNTDKAVAILVALAAHSRTTHHLRLTHGELISILSKRKNSMDLLLQLYAYSDFIDDLSIIPVEARTRLIDHALDKKEITQAARLMRSLDSVPADQDPFVWRLRKARVLILDGAYREGEQVLYKLFENLPQALGLDFVGPVREDIDSVFADKLDRIMQVLFDLQSVQRHQAALDLFRDVARLPLQFQLQRELYFWMAQSEQALSNYAAAAMNFLRSARMEDGGMSDQWALSSRLKAAEALVKAGLFDDAETLYRRLLRVTANESRKAMIEQEMQQIYLLRNASEAEVENDRLR